MRKIDSIILHCSASPFGNAVLIDQWHRQRGWEGIGYHYVITNQYPHTVLIENKMTDGMIEVGRDIRDVGAHCEGFNENSVGICLVGNPGQFTVRQYTTSRALIRQTCKDYDIIYDNVFGHCEFNPEKICPGIDMDVYRLFISSNQEKEIKFALETLREAR